MKNFGLGVAIVIYSFTASFAFARYLPDGVMRAPSTLQWVNDMAGFVDGILLGAFWPVTILTPIILVLGYRRFSMVWNFGLLAIALIACYIGYSLANTGVDYLTPFWSAVVSAMVNIPVLVVWTILLGSLVQRVRAN